MLMVYRNACGDIEFAAECQVVDSQGHLQPDGQYVWVERVELNTGLDVKAYLRRLILLMARLHPAVQDAYWTRFWERPAERKQHRWTRTQLLRWARSPEGVTSRG